VENDLTNIKEALATLDMDLSLEINEINQTIDKLDTQTLGSIKLQLSTIETKLNLLDSSSGKTDPAIEDILTQLLLLSDKLDAFVADTNTNFDNITSLLAAVDQIETLSKEYKTLQAELTDLESDLEKLENVQSDIQILKEKQAETNNKASDSSSKSNWLLILVIILFVIIIAMAVFYYLKSKRLGSETIGNDGKHGSEPTMKEGSKKKIS